VDDVHKMMREADRMSLYPWFVWVHSEIWSTTAEMEFKVGRTSDDLCVHQLRIRDDKDAMKELTELAGISYLTQRRDDHNSSTSPRGGQ
jgi:hypothetical protein